MFTMVDISALEQTGVKIGVKEVPQESLMMRWGDGGDAVTLYLSQKKGDYTLDYKTGIRSDQSTETTVTPVFTQSIASGSIINFGEGQTFIVASPNNRGIEERYPDSVFVKRIPLYDATNEKGEKIEGYDTLAEKLKREGNSWMILSMKDDNIPLSDRTKNQLRNVQ